RLVPPARGGRGIIGPGGSAAALVEAADAAARDLNQEMAPLAGALRHLAERIEPLAEPDPTSTDGVRALRHLAGMYLEWDRLPDAAAVLREGMVSARCAPADRRPGDGGVRDRRERICLDGQSPLLQARNDILHAGFKENPARPDRLRDMLKRGLDELDAAIEAGQSEPGGDRGDSPARFLNLSNHPSDRWPAEQIQAAIALDESIESIVDIPFPTVPPDADDAAIEALAQETVAQVPHDIAAAMVMGEMCATVAIVRLLQKRGVRCVAATTHRGRGPGDFRFVRWRDYPRIAGDLPGNHP
ncbi:MAG: hypothetical protein D6798_15070, partial [Deltaproteobacteria bacterium]